MPYFAKHKSLPFLLMLMLALFTVGCTKMQSIDPAELEKVVSKSKNAKLLVVDVYHDRCESCKQIEPVMKVLEEDYTNDEAISFLKYDLSNPLTIHRSKKIAKELGLEDIYKAQRYSGIVLFIDNKTKQVSDTLIAEYDIEKYKTVIKEKLN